LATEDPNLASAEWFALDTSAVSGYTFGMKTAISLPEKVFREAERFARRVRKTRSRLYAEAIAEYLARHAPDDITESMNRVCDRVGVAKDTFHSKAARKILAREAW
jgi:metal-responsive CopG/Arc/MetJ family transcriptional regulator